MTDVDPTRRAVLLAAGLGVGLFGAAAVDTGDDTPDVSYDTAAVRRVAELGQPRLPASWPVSVEQSHAAASRERAESLLDAAPEAPDIPNEAVAREYDDRYADAVGALARAAETRRPSERLASLRWARSRAADVNAVAAALVGELTHEAVLAKTDAVRESLDSLRGRWRYRGDDPTVAAAVHSDVENDVAHAEALLEQLSEPRGRSERHVLGVGSNAGTVELARAVVEDAAYLHDGFVAGLDDPHRLRPTFDRAARTLAADVTTRCPDRRAEPWESRAERDPPAVVARPLLRAARTETVGRCGRLDERRERSGVATAVVAAGAADRDLRAFEAVRTALKRGEYDRPRSVTSVRHEKLDALAAIQTAMGTPPSAVAVPWTGEAVDAVGRGDERLVRAIEGDHLDVRAVGEAVAWYAWGRRRAAAIPDALARLRGVLDAAVVSERRGD